MGSSTQPLPLQILDFEQNPDPEKTNKILVLKEDVINQVFQDAGERRVAIIAIAGPSRKGKSFFLDFVIRYLEALEKDECEDWMGWEDKTQPLTGFSWKTSTERETLGIWIWSKPFIIKGIKGEEVAVILMDSQGTYDEFTTEREMSAIVGLSLLSSSCLIFNFSNGIQEDVFNSLDTYIQYGQLALGGDDAEGDEKMKPFQKLFFLVRNWDMPTVHPFGLKGGKDYLKKKLTIVPGLTEAGEKVRKTLNNCFTDLDCCLLPTLGGKSMEAGFNGSLAQLGQSFCKKIEELINEFGNPDDMPLKTIFGNALLAVDVPDYFKKYVEVFNGDDIPAPLTLMEATAKIANDNLVNSGVRKYKENMKKKLRGKPFLSESALLKIHKAVMKDVIDYFDNSRKMGNEESIQSYKEDLVFKIKDQAFDAIEHENNRKMRTIIDATIDECISSFKNEIQEQAFEDEDSFLAEKKLQSIMTSQKNTCVSDMKEKLSQCDEKELEKIESHLEMKLDQEAEKFLMENKTRKLSAEKKMTEQIKKLCNFYKLDLETQIEEDPYMTEEELVEYHTNAKPELKKKFDSLKIFKKDFIKQYQALFEDELEKQFEDVKKSQQIKLAEEETLGEALLNETLAEFESSLRSVVDAEPDGNTQEELVKKTEKDFISKIPTPPSHKLGKHLINKFKAELESKVASVNNEIMLSKKHCEESYRQAVDEAYNVYFQDFEGFINGCGNNFHEDDAVIEKHEEFQNKAIVTYEAFPKVGVHPNPMQFSQELEEKIQKYFENAKQKNSSNKELAISKAENAGLEAHQAYQSEMMKNLDVAKDEKHFQELHEEAKKAAIDDLKKKCDKMLSKFLDPIIQTLKTDIDTTFHEELEGVFELKLTERGSETESALSEARKLYREEMEKHYKSTDFMRPKDLKELHEKMSKLAISKCEEKTVLSQWQKQDLEDALLETFKSYEEDNDKNVPTNPAIGIDLGTTYSCVAVYLKGSVKVIPNAQGKNTTPSYVSFTEAGTFESVGIPAKEKAYENAENTVYDAKRILGRGFDDADLQNDMKFWPFNVVNDKQVPKIEINGKKFFPEEISSHVLREMKRNAEKYLGDIDIENAVITVPAYFTDGQRQATIDAGTSAGLKVLNILTEPVAAAVAYKLQHNDDSIRHVLTFDLGGGTFDVAILKMSKGKIETLGVDGDTHLGGEDFDQNIMTYCALEFQKEHGIDLMDGKDSSNDVTKQEVRRRLKRLQLECERRKIELASCRSVDICVDGIHNEGGVSTDLKVKLTRDKFEQLNEALFEKTIQIVEHCLKDARIDKSKINDIVLVGGSTRIPKVQELLKTFFDDRALNVTINPDEAVAYGAAVQAAQLNGQLAQKSKDYNTIQDVTPMSLGVEVYGGDFSIIIPKNTKVPVKFKETYRTAHNNQTSVKVTVFQGEDDVAMKNNWLGDFYLNNIPPADAEKEKIEVFMEINVQGVLHVTAVCASTGESDSITVTEHKRRMNKEQIKRILDEGRSGGA